MSTRLLAEQLAEAGVPVFPCRADKRPACLHGLLDASDQLDTVRELWRRFPGPLIGVPTGLISGFDVLDVDPRHGGDRWWIANMHRLPATRMQRTRSGGLHTMFQADSRVRNSASKIAPGIDVRGSGGYVVWWTAEGCEVSEAPLAPWPTWLLRRALKRPTPPRRSCRQPLAPLDTSDAAKRVAERVLQRLENASPGTFHISVRKAGWTIGGLLDRLPFDETEAKRRILDAVTKAGATGRTAHEKTAAWALACGRSQPLRPAERR